MSRTNSENDFMDEDQDRQESAWQTLAPVARASLDTPKQSRDVLQQILLSR
jgi:hypothetical protein